MKRETGGLKQCSLHIKAFHSYLCALSYNHSSNFFYETSNHQICRERMAVDPTYHIFTPVKVFVIKVAYLRRHPECV